MCIRDSLTINDVQRRNRITRLLADWGLITIVKEDSVENIAPLNQIKVLSYKDKGCLLYTSAPEQL